MIEQRCDESTYHGTWTQFGRKQEVRDKPVQMREEQSDEWKSLAQGRQKGEKRESINRKQGLLCL